MHKVFQELKSVLWTLWLYRKRILHPSTIKPINTFSWKKAQTIHNKNLPQLAWVLLAAKKKPTKFPYFAKKIQYELRHQGGVWIPSFLCFRIAFFYSFFFSRILGQILLLRHCLCTVHEQQPQSLTCQIIFNKVHCSLTHKFHFSAIFSLKMGPTILFIHLKIILLQYFLVFNFQLYPNRPYIKRI